MKVPELRFFIENPKKISPKYIAAHYPEFYDFLMNKYKNSNMRISEMLYRYFYNIAETPLCPVCGSPLSYRNFLMGFSKYCGSACVSRSNEVRAKYNNTLITRYGTTSYNNRTKAIETYRSKYGCDNPFQSDIVKDKIKTTMNEKYGVDYPSQSNMIQKTREINSIKKYGVSHHMKVTDIKYRVLKSNQNYNIENCPDLISYTDSGDRVMNCPHPTCDKCEEKCYIIDSNNYFARKQFSLELCTKLLPIQSGHSSGTTLELFVRNILNEYNIKYTNNVRHIIPPFELDIYIPDKRVAIEVNGLYWHSRKDSYYHYNKYKICNENGIQLITIWEDQIYNKPDIVKSIILSKLGIYNNKIGARECRVQEINPSECARFLNENHLQGATKPKVRLGLYYSDELVAVMTFAIRSGVSGSKVNKEWELTRFCNKQNHTIIGGASKLLMYFVRLYNPNIIYSFASNDISNGSLYKTLGFDEEDVSASYWYISKNDLKRYHRTRFTKSNLKKMGYSGVTEESIMNKLPFYRIFDCGHTRYKLTTNN